MLREPHAEIDAILGSMGALVGQHGRSHQHDFGHMHIRNGVDTITRWVGNPSWNSGRMQLGGTAVLVSKDLPSTIHCPSVANHRLDFKQTSSLADGTQSLFPFAAERPTSHSSRTWLVCKTQLLLPWLNPSSSPVLTTTYKTHHRLQCPCHAHPH